MINEYLRHFFDDGMTWKTNGLVSSLDKNYLERVFYNAKITRGEKVENVNKIFT